MRKAKTNLLSKLILGLSKEIRENKLKKGQNPTVNLYDRRKFIHETTKGVLGASIALSFPTLLASCNGNNSNDQTILDIAILGGGISGLNCANHLLNSKLNFKVFEAQKRLGGRILTHYNDSLGLGIFPEFGGDFIDTNHQDMLALAKEFNLELIDRQAGQMEIGLPKDIYFFDNRKITEKEVISEFKKIAGKIAQDKASLGEDFDTPEAKALDNTPLSDYFNSLSCKQWLKDLLAAAFIAEFGLDCKLQSSLNFFDMIETDTSEGFRVFGESDERYRVKGGNSKIIEALEKKIGPDKIQKISEVTEITEDNDGNYLIAFKDGNKITTRTIVCTIPFSILRKIKLNLKTISPEKRKCIDELGYGMNTKLILGYNGTPWSNRENKPIGHLFHKDIVNGWDGSYNKTDGNTNGAYVCYLGGGFSENLNTLSSGHKMAPATHIWKTELPQKEINNLVDELNEVFTNSKKDFLNKHVFVNWIDFPFTKGSYSCYKVGQWSTIAGLEIEPIGNFYFAGEHCSEMFQGFMNGGAETGRRVAEILLKKISSEKSA